MTVKTVDDSAGFGGLVQKLLVNAPLPRLGLPNGNPGPSKFQHEIALRKVTNSMSKLFATGHVHAT